MATTGASLLRTPQTFTENGDRCFRRWADLKYVQMIATQPALYSGPKPKFTSEEFSTLLRERYLLYVNCLESAPGQEPTAPYLFA
jgi:hypothetical protein